jgi:hypothetical protein
MAQEFVLCLLIMLARREVPKTLRGTPLAARSNSSNSLRITSLAAPRSLTPVESHPYPKNRGGPPLPFSLFDLPSPLTSLECAVPRFGLLSPLECAVAKMRLRNSFRMRSSEKKWGEGGTSFRFPISSFAFRITNQELLAGLAQSTLTQNPSRGCLPNFQFRFSSFQSGGSALFQVAFPAVAIGHRHAPAHKTRGGKQQQEHGLVDRALAAFGAGLHVARTHRAALAEGRRYGAQATKE